MVDCTEEGAMQETWKRLDMPIANILKEVLPDGEEKERILRMIVPIEKAYKDDVKATKNDAAATPSVELDRQKILKRERDRRYREKKKNDAAATPLNNQSPSNGFLNNPSLTTPTHPLPKNPLKGVKKVSPSHPRGSRFAKQENIPAEWAAWAKTEVGFDLAHAQNEYQKFSDYWTAKAGSNGVKLDWFATWRNWCRKEWNQPTNQPVKPTQQQAGKRPAVIPDGHRWNEITGRVEQIPFNIGLLSSDELKSCQNNDFPAVYYYELKNKGILPSNYNWQLDVAENLEKQWRANNG